MVFLQAMPIRKGIPGLDFSLNDLNRGCSARSPVRWERNPPTRLSSDTVPWISEQESFQRGSARALCSGGLQSCRLKPQLCS